MGEGRVQDQQQVFPQLPSHADADADADADEQTSNIEEKLQQK